MASIKLNTLYVTTDNLYLHHEGDLIKVKKKQETLLRIPFHHIDGIVFLSYSSISPSLLQKCLIRGLPVAFLSERGRFLGRLEGYNPGNVLLRKEQFRKADSPDYKLRFAKAFIAGKIQNARLNLLRSARDSGNQDAQNRIKQIITELENNLSALSKASDVASLRGFEGDSARKYFSVFNDCILHQNNDFSFDRRTKRPPRSRLNAMLSFAYSLFTNDCISACQAAGLDPYIGFLHEERPGRPSLALDLVEEFRPLADRFVFTLINRKQIQAKDIEARIGGVYNLSEAARKKFLAAYQNRKQEEITHPHLDFKCRIGAVFILQARILARAIRDEAELYIPFIWG